MFFLLIWRLTMRFKILGLVLAVLLLFGGCASANADIGAKALAPASTETTGAAPADSAAAAAPSAEVSLIPSPSPVPPPSASPLVSPENTASANDENSKYFTDGKEEITADTKKGVWEYRSNALYVHIERVTVKKKVQTYFVADVRLKEGERETAGFANPKKPGTMRLEVYQIMKKYGAVVAVNGDYMDRVEAEKKGIIMRNGKVYSQMKAADTLAFYPDGTMRVFEPGEKTAKELKSEGVKNTFSFGPTLVKDGEVQSDLGDNAYVARQKHPRTAVGMIAPYHFVLIVVDGRQSGYSKGMYLKDLAQVFKDKGCTLAYNLDGGASSTMSFMGKNINKYKGSTTGQRGVPDTLMFGKSDSVPKK
jgi:exopolysaccharide biosynthesis protein